MKYLHVTPVIGLPQVTGWSQVAENPHTAQNRFICAFALHGEQVGNIGRDISEDIAQFEPHTLEEAYSFLEKLEERYQDSNISFYFAAGIFLHNQVAYAVKGGSVLLKREGKVGPIVHSEGGIKLVTGKYTLDDVIVLATNQATGFFNEVEQKFKTGFDTDTIITSIVPGLHARQDSSLSALAFIIPSEKEQVEEEQDKVFFEASLETDAEESQIVVEEESSVGVSESVTEDEAAALSPQVSPDNLGVPSEQTVAELGLNEPPPKESKPNPLIAKAGNALKKFIVLIGRGFAALFLLFITGLRGLFRRLKQFEWSQLTPKNISSALQNKIMKRGQYLNSGKSKRWLSLIVVVVVFAIAIAAGWYLYSHQVATTRAEAQAELEPLVTQLEEAQGDVTTNPVVAREAVARTIRELEVLKAEQEELGNTIYVEEIEEQLAAAHALYEEISGREEFAELPIFYDLRLVDSDFVVTNADAFGNIAALVDNEQQQLVILNLEQKQPISISLSELGEIVDVRVRENDVLILADGIYSVSLEEGATPTLLVPEGDSNRQATFLGAYDRYVYVLNPDSRNVYRYAEGEDGEFSDPIGWMQAARGLLYDTVTSWTIDGDIWMTTAEGEVLRFTSGEAVDYSVNGLPEPLNASLRIATVVESENLYILEPDNHRLVVLAKNGDFLREVNSVSLASTNSLIISESLGKAFAVSGSILFEIEL